MNCLNSLQEPQVSESLSQNFSIWRPPCPCCHLWKEPNLLPQGVSSSRRSWYPPLCHVHVPSAALFDPQSCNLRTTSNVRGCPLSIMFSSSKLFENHLWIPAPWPRSLFSTETPLWCSNRIQCAAVVLKSFGRCRPPAAHVAAAFEPGCWRKLAQKLLFQKRCRISAARKWQGYQKVIVQNFPEETVSAETFIAIRIFFFLSKIKLAGWFY